MDARLLEHAAEFCKLVAKPDLLDYLGLTSQSNPEEVREALGRRRRYMQGMQSNPKYAAEARAFIKSFGEFQALLQDPLAYSSAAARRRESTHLPVLEMTIKGALRGGPPSTEQLDFLRRNATELGVGEQTFVDVLDRLARDAGVSLQAPVDKPQAPPRPARSVASGGNVTLQPIDPSDRVSPGPPDHFRVLGLAREATDAQITASYQQRAQAARERGDTAALTRLDAAYSVLGDPAQRSRYSISLTATGPPARDRDFTDPRAEAKRQATAPPVRPRSPSPRRVDDTPRLGFGGELIRAVQGRGATPMTLTVLADPDDPVPPRLVADQPWVRIDHPPVAGRREQAVMVTIDVAAVPQGQGRCQLALTNDRGERALMIVDATRTPGRRVGWLAAAAGGLVFLIGAATLIGVTSRPSVPPRLHIIVEPVADHVWLDGKDLGPGSSFAVPRPDRSVPLVVETTGFRRFETTSSTTGPQLVQLEPKRPLDFVPGPDALRGSLPVDDVNLAMAPRREGINRCFARSRTTLVGTLRVFVDATGQPAGVTLEGGGADDPAILSCVRREAAAAVFPAVTGGDYATVRYDYAVNPESP